MIHGPKARALVIALVALPTCQVLYAGEKQALVVGINAYAPPDTLRGCLNDAQNIRNLLTQRFEFPDGNVTMLLDREATRSGILAAFDRFASHLRSGDLFVFYFSGHGTLFPDELSEEQDETVVLPARPPYVPRAGRYDSAICPVDVGQPSTSGKPWRNLILDDELFHVFSKFTERGVSVILLADSCHSGTLARSVGTETISYRIKAIPMERALGVPIDQISPPALSRSIESRDLGGRYLALTGSKDDQFSLEYRDQMDRPCGLFTHQLLKAIDALGGTDPSRVTYRAIYDYLRREALRISTDDLQSPQEPQVDTRFFAGNLETALFSLAGGSTPFVPAPVAGPPGAVVALRVIVRVRDLDNQPLEDAFFVIFRPGARPQRGNIRAADALVLGKTDRRGLFEGSGNAVAPGVYRVKVVKEGYEVFEGDTEIRDSGSHGMAVLSFHLKRE